MIYYMGIMRLPAKRDYWTTELWMPVHTVAKANNLGRDRFEFMWKNFQVNEGLAEENLMVQVDGDDSLVETIAEVGYLIDHIKTVILSLIYVLGTFLSLDEMMIRFFGRSIETHQMKNKPIKEGYIFLF
eukprot:CAMPEP_0171296326 /NCGR_PEP_ID=MMETSP0816-20121228/4979_1 /TAXON_ID=420281 /ORGANISM="Proboscia inermis, Strain CCAP1064/1" /LENGTH=128 /DNA_ID=CAMNT_0011769667 /DNA_START=287 /DNA_END=673 /DNA_ORIENTATION=-